MDGPKSDPADGRDFSRTSPRRGGSFSESLALAAINDTVEVEIGGRLTRYVVGAELKDSSIDNVLRAALSDRTFRSKRTG
jgi:hypothetical protein